MNLYHINWLFEELGKLEKEKVITQTASDKIKSYYEKKIEEQKQQEQRMLEEKKKKNIPVSMVLSIIAALLVAGGIISIIAYNWASISRVAKTAAAFVIMFTTPAVYAFMKFKLKKDISVRINEVITILWSILFGAGISFISQIYRLPSNPALFFLVWAVSTILILYCTESYFAFAFSILLTVIYCMVGQFVMRTDAVFAYLLIAAVVPFALSKKGFKYVSVAETVFLLGFVLEKSIPGLWILCYVSLFVLMFNFGIEKDEKVFKYSGGAGCVVLLALLSYDYFWKDIGLSFYRNTEGFNAAASVCDYIVTTLLVFAGCAASVKPVVKKLSSGEKSDIFVLQTASVLFLLLIYVWFVCCSINPHLSVFTKDLFFIFVFLLSYVFIASGKSSFFYISLLAVLFSGLYAGINYAVPFVIVEVFIIYINLSRNNVFESTGFRQKNADNIFIIPAVLSLVVHSISSFDVINENYSGYCLNVSVLLIAIALCAFELIPYMKRVYKTDKDRFITLVEFTVINAVSLFFITWKSLNMEFSFIPYPEQKAIMLAEKYFILAAAVYYFVMNLIKKRSEMPAVIFAFLTISISVNDRLFILIASAFACGLYLWFLESKNKYIEAPAVVIAKSFMVFFSVIAVFFCQEFSYNIGFTVHMNLISSLYLIFTVALFEVIPFVKAVFEKKKIDYPVVLMALLFILMLFSPDKMHGERLFKEILSYAFLTLVVLYCVLGMFKSYRKGSLSQFNLYIVLMSFVILIKFFLVSEGLVQTGVMFICFGIGMFIMNQIFLNRQKKEAEGGNGNENK